MLKLINKYRSLPFEKKTILNTKISIITNWVFAIGKIILSFFSGVFFLVAGIVNVMIANSKLICYYGMTRESKKPLEQRNIWISVFLLIAGLEYGIYASRLVFTDVSVMDYDMYLGIIVACVSFVEITFAIKGIFDATKKGHYYRNIKLINFTSALSAIALTEMALMSFASTEDSRILDGIFGMAVGFITILISIYIYFAPRISIVDREVNNFKALDNTKLIDEDEINIPLTNSKFYGNYAYIGKKNNDIIEGKIVKGTSPIFSWNIWIKILVIVLSEILIFPYAVGAFIHHVKSSQLIKKLNNHMNNLGYINTLDLKEGKNND